MKEFEVEYERTIQGIITVQADSEENAKKIAEQILENNEEHHAGGRGVELEDGTKGYYAGRNCEVDWDDIAITDAFAAWDEAEAGAEAARTKGTE